MEFTSTADGPLSKIGAQESLTILAVFQALTCSNVLPFLARKRTPVPNGKGARDPSCVEPSWQMDSKGSLSQ